MLETAAGRGHHRVMSRLRRRLIAALLGAALAACASGRPALPPPGASADRIDDAAEALAVRIVDAPRDVGLRLALADLEERRGRPAAALDQLEAAAALGGPFGSRLGAADRARLGRLLAARGAERAARGAPAAPDDLDRAAGLGITVDPAVRRAAGFGAALADLRHSDAERRDRGRRRLAALAADNAGDPRLAAADVAAAIAAGRRADVARAGVWLWEGGARRAALEALDAWEQAGGIGDDVPGAADRWLRARRWWRGPEGRPDLATLRRAVAAGASPCLFAGGPVPCSPVIAAYADDPDGPPWEPDLAATAAAPTADPVEAAAWLVIVARQGASFDDAVRARVDVAAVPCTALPAVPCTALPPFARPTLLRLAGRGDDARVALERAVRDAPRLPPGPRLVIAVEAARAGQDVAAILGDARPRAAAGLLAPAPTEVPTFDAVAAAFAARGALQQRAALGAIAAAHRRDAALGDRRAADFAAGAADRVPRALALADLYDALGDPARARGWAEAAHRASPGELATARRLVAALARAGDPDAAAVVLVGAAAASGDPGAALVEAAGELAPGAPVHALDVLKLALQLIAPGQRGPALALVASVEAALERPPTDELARAIAAEPAPPAVAPIAVPPVDDPARPAAIAALVARAAEHDDAIARPALAALRGLLP
jgi:hypothetical protein